MYKAMLLYQPVKLAKKGTGGAAGGRHLPGGEAGNVLEIVQTVQTDKAVEAFCREFEPEDAAIWRDILGKNMYYPQSMLGNQELQKLFREMDKGIL